MSWGEVPGPPSGAVYNSTTHHPDSCTVTTMTDEGNDWRAEIRRKGVRVGSIHEVQFRAVVKDMGGPGWYPAADLHAWYLSLIREDGFIGVGPVTFGRFLRHLGLRASVRRVCGTPTRGWLVTNKWDRPPDPNAPPLSWPPDPDDAPSTGQPT